MAKLYFQVIVTEHEMGTENSEFRYIDSCEHCPMFEDHKGKVYSVREGWHEELSPQWATAENALAGVNQSTGQSSDEIYKAVYKKVDMRDIYRSIKSMTKDEAKAFAGFVRLSVAAHIGEPGFLDIVGCEAQ